MGEAKGGPNGAEAKFCKREAVKKCGKKRVRAAEERRQSRATLELFASGGHDGAFDSLVSFLPASAIVCSLPLTSKKFAEAMKEARGNPNRGFNDFVKRSLRALYQQGEDKYRGLHFAKQDTRAGRANIEAAARYGLRSAVARCKAKGWGCDMDLEGAAHLRQVERASNPSDAGGGKCQWSAYYLYARSKVVWFGRNLALLHEAADERGNSLAMFRLAEHYEMPSTVGKALDYYVRASAAGNVFAAGCLAVKYEFGYHSLRPNLAEAARLYAIAKEKDTPNVSFWAAGLRRVNRTIAGAKKPKGVAIFFNDPHNGWRFKRTGGLLARNPR